MTIEQENEPTAVEGAGDDQGAAEDRAAPDFANDLTDDDVFAPDPEADGEDVIDLDRVPDADTGYSYEVPEGMELNEQLADSMDKAFREVGLTQGQANKLVEAYATAHRDHLVGNVQQMLGGWVETAKADKEIGGRNWSNSIATAEKVIDKFGTPELMQDVIRGQGLGAHPEIIRLLKRIGESLSDDTLSTEPKQPPSEGTWDYSATTPTSKQG